MGHHIRQTIYTCDICDKTPEDGESLWHMNSEVWCESCCDINEGVEEIPQFQGTTEALINLTGR